MAWQLTVDSTKPVCFLDTHDCGGYRQLAPWLQMAGMMNKQFCRPMEHHKHMTQTLTTRETLPCMHLEHVFKLAEATIAVKLFTMHADEAGTHVL